jgi:hypothetical protein
MMPDRCAHDNPLIWIGSDNKVYATCSKCNINYQLTTNYNTNTFRTNQKPTNYEKKIYTIIELKDGSYLYERKLSKPQNTTQNPE